jgi:hypothetical protein
VYSYIPMRSSSAVYSLHNTQRIISFLFRKHSSCPANIRQLDLPGDISPLHTSKSCDPSRIVNLRRAYHSTTTHEKEYHARAMQSFKALSLQASLGADLKGFLRFLQQTDIPGRPKSNAAQRISYIRGQRKRMPRV